MKKNVLFITKKYIIESLGIGYLSAHLKNSGFKVDLLQISEDTDYVSYVRDTKPDFICYSVWTGSQGFFYRVNEELKKHFYFTSIFGGHHATFCTKDMLSKAHIDYVVKGEAEVCLVDLCLKVINGEKPSKLIQVISPPQDLDELLVPDRELLYKYKHNLDNPIRSIMSSRGCPFVCTFCFNSKYNEIFKGKKLRHRQIIRVIEEASEIKSKFNKTKYFFFQDDEMGASKTSLQILAAHWRDKVGTPFHVQMRIEYITDERIQLLKMAGCNSITFALESANEDNRRNVLGKTFSQSKVDAAIEVLHNNKMRFRIENMLGIPFCDSIKDMWETFAFNKKAKPSLSWASLCQPYPGTELGDKCLKVGLFTGDISEIPESFFAKTVLMFPKKDKIMLENMQRLFSVLVDYKVPNFLAAILLKIKLPVIYSWIGNKHKQKLFKRLYGL